MLVTLSGIATLPFTPNTTVFPSFDSIRPLQEEYFGLFAPMENDVSPEHPENAVSSMLVTPFGIVTEVSPEQPSNAEYPMLVTLSGIVTDASPEQTRNA